MNDEPATLPSVYGQVEAVRAAIRETIDANTPDDDARLFQMAEHIVRRARTFTRPATSSFDPRTLALKKQQFAEIAAAAIEAIESIERRPGGR